METWKTVIGYENIYEVSDLGRVRSVDRVVDSGGRKFLRKGKILGLYKRQEKYLTVSLSKEGKSKTFTVHRLVALHFLDNQDDKLDVNHIDGNKENNHASNLEWVTRSENVIHAHKSGLRPDNEGEKHHKSKLTEDDVRWIRNNYIPFDDNFNAKEIAKKFGVAYMTVYLIVTNKTWKHLL
ncbi:HNH endonuclease [Bacillus phage vB_BanS_Sophrita]|uniref:HNH homing endonuclease n=1 Tax=Bacillus phage vB_BanS_Sophrita TaxID=2894790 RepID=A0AAE8YXH4_9CAUD|nr:HNH endonuclease [Bacillus phage vB_BanS_Sophrita]UGO50839.1 HNH homing endonuclease [Bacillus phage vB_BanS_Sophrita]